MNISNCCGAPPIDNTDICSKCKEHADFNNDLLCSESEQSTIKDIDEKSHRDRHITLYKHLNELVVDWISCTSKLPSKTSILKLLKWAHKQSIKPDHEV